jgi:branched-chain amino acid transport system permease protein
MQDLIQVVINGIAIGAVYALFGVGFALVFGVLGALNMAYAMVFAWSALLGVYALQWFGSSSIVLALVVGASAGAALNLVVEAVAFRPLRWRGTYSSLTPFISSLGAFIIMKSVALNVTNGNSKRYPFDIFPFHLYQVGRVAVTSLTVFTVGVAVAMMLILHLTLRYTRFGKSIRAVADNPGVSQLLGIRPEWSFAYASLIGGAVAGVAGVLIGVTYGQVSGDMGDTFLLKALIVVVVGGVGSLGGALLAAVLVGLIESFTAFYWTSAWQDIVLFAILLGVLLVRPSGLFGREERLRT